MLDQRTLGNANNGAPAEEHTWLSLFAAMLIRHHPARRSLSKGADVAAAFQPPASQHVMHVDDITT